MTTTEFRELDFLNKPKNKKRFGKKLFLVEWMRS